MDSRRLFRSLFTGDAAEVTAPPEFYENGFVGQGVTVGGTYRRVTAK
jgi:hypothetical protein